MTLCSIGLCHEPAPLFRCGEISLEIDVDQGLVSLPSAFMRLSVRCLFVARPLPGVGMRWLHGRANRDGLIKDASGNEYQLPVNLAAPNAIHGFGITSSWEELGDGYFSLDLPAPYRGARVEQRYEILDNALRWSLEYELVIAIYLFGWVSSLVSQRAGSWWFGRD